MTYKLYYQVFTKPASYDEWLNNDNNHIFEKQLDVIT